MTDLMASQKKYRDLIKEAYIDPICTAVVVDDKFPTMDRLLNGDATCDPVAKAQLLGLLNTFRGANYKWLVDVHDGTHHPSLEEMDRYASLHHSDLLVLDYHLNGDDGSDRAIDVLRTLAGSDYFNLVIVYTSCAEDELSLRACEIARGLSYYNFDSLESFPEAKDALMDWEDDEEGIFGELNGLLDEAAVLQVINCVDKSTIKTLSCLSALVGRIGDRKRITRGDKRLDNLLSHIIALRILSLRESLSNHDFGTIQFSTSSPNWIKSDRLFVTVIPKRADPNLLPGLLLDALEASSPEPNRLLMTKIKNVLDVRGGSAESLVLKNRYIQAGWLKSMLEADGNEQPWRIKQTMNKHWEGLATVVQNDIYKFSAELFHAVNDGCSVQEAVARHTSVNLATEANTIAKHLNNYVCMKEVEGPHLMTGHIISFKRGEAGEVEYWVCLSPACDLVPNQSGQRWGNKKTINEKIITFKALRLCDINISTALRDVNTNEYIFCLVDGEIKSFGYRSGSKDNPIWEQMFAHNNGLLDGGGHQIALSLIDISVEANGDSLVGSKKISAQIIAQLRYEYALNLLQKLAGSMSRVGLDFVSHS